MKKYILILLPCLIMFNARSQEVIDLMNVEPAQLKENVTVEPLTTDSLASSFLIWIGSGVAAHFHSRHTEHVYILEGSGMMQLGDSSFQVSAGHFIFIPKGTVHAVEVTSEETMKALSIQTPEFKGVDRIFVRPGQDRK